MALVVGAAVLVERAAHRAGAQRRAWTVWVAYVVTAAVGIWMFAYVALVLPAYAILADRSTLRPWRRVRRALIIVAAPATIAAPLIVMLTRQTGQVSWLAGQQVNLYTVLIEPVLSWAAWLAVIIVVILVIGVRRGALRWTRPIAALTVWALLPGAVLIAITLVHTPLFTPRYLAICAPAAAILCGIAMKSLSRRALLAVCLVWAIAATPFFVSSRLPTAKPGGLDLRAVATVISDQAEAEDGFLLAADGFSPVQPRVAVSAYPSSFAELRDLALVRAYPETGTYRDVLTTPSLEELSSLPRVWVASYDDDPFADLFSNAGFHRTLITTITGIEVARWDASE